MVNNKIMHTCKLSGHGSQLSACNTSCLEIHYQILRIVDLSEDQDSTDLMKCLKCALKHIQEEPARFGRATILALGGIFEVNPNPEP